MEGKLSTEADDESSINPSRRRVLKASAALSATGVVSSGFVGSAAGKHEPCPRSTQCNASITFNDQTVGTCESGTVPDSVVIARCEITCPNGGWVDLHDKSTKTGPSGSYKAGYPVGMSTIFQQGTYTDKTICLFRNSEDVPNRTECQLNWDRCNWPSDKNASGTRSMGAMLHLDDPSPGTITHYCDHGGPATVPDHAYLCDQDGDGDLEPIQDVAAVAGNGSQVCGPGR